MKRQQGGLYRSVTQMVLTDKKATKEEVLGGFDWILNQTTSCDVAMILLAGHGENDRRGDYFFYPHNINPDKPIMTGVYFADIKKMVEGLAGKVVVFVDTCRAGNVLGAPARRALSDINGFVNELTSAENGAIDFASSTGNQYSLEKEAWDNGAFTKAVVEGIGGRAALPRTGKITVSSLDAYVSERVKKLTEGKQTPPTTKPKTVPDFPIAVNR